jgi:DNA polymerase
MTLADIERRAADKPEALRELSDSLVFGEGPADARLMLVGEAPGEEEDLSGRPFVGRAGQLLDRILESVGLDRGDVYITNLVKYRPPGNRNPRPEEIEASEPVLLDQIRAIGPQVIGTLGNVPTQWFLDTKDGITKLHGTWHRWHGIRVMPLYHPAYLLRNPSRERGGPKWQMWQAMKELKALLDELPERHEPLALDTAQQQGLF